MARKKSDVNGLKKLTLATYEKVKQELAKVEAELESLTAHRDQLRELSVALLEVSATAGASAPPAAKAASKKEEPAAAAEPAPAAKPAKGKKAAKPAPKKASKAAKPAKGKSKRSKNSKDSREVGKLWKDVSSIMKGNGPMKAGDVIDELLKKDDYKSSTSMRTYVYSSLGRWAKRGDLDKVSRGVYELN